MFNDLRKSNQRISARGREWAVANRVCGAALASAEEREMPKFKVMVADEQGHTLYDEWIEAADPKEACAKATVDAGTVDVAESELTENNPPAALYGNVE